MIRHRVRRFRDRRTLENDEQRDDVDTLFDEQAVSSIGDVAIAPSNPSVIYVGTGERTTARARRLATECTCRSTPERPGCTSGSPIRKASAVSSSIRRIRTRCSRAAVGHLFGPNKERGLFKTVDGGATWANTKFIDEDTVSSMSRLICRTAVLYASFPYQRRRVPSDSAAEAGQRTLETTDAGEDGQR